MGVRFREPTDSAAASVSSTSTTSSSLRELLLFTTMSIIGLTVEVHIKDGSVYSGIFHTASVDKGYGVVLKKARLIKEGTHASNGINRSLIDTLVILPGNLVQVLAKSVIISPDGVCGGIDCDNAGAVTSDSKSCGSPEKSASSANLQSDEQKNISVRQDGVHKLQEEGSSNAKPGSSYQKEEQATSISCKLERSQVQAKSMEENDKAITKQLPNRTPGKIASETVKTVSSLISDKTCSSSTTTTYKESKLNPGAKKFSPSFTNMRSVAASPVLPGGANVAYVPPNHLPALPSGITSFSPTQPLPLKLVSYGNINGATASLQYNTQPIAGPIPTRPHLIRYTNQYQQYQPGPLYAQPVHQTGLIARAGQQLVYLNPATHEMVPNPISYSHVSHPQLTSHPLHFPKHEGTIAAPPPQLSYRAVMPNEQLSFALPNPIPFPQPVFPVLAPYGVKYL